MSGTLIMIGVWIGAGGTVLATVALAAALRISHDCEQRRQAGRCEPHGPSVPPRRQIQSPIPVGALAHLLS